VRRFLPGGQTVGKARSNAGSVEGRTADAALGACLDDERHAGDYLAGGSASNIHESRGYDGKYCGAITSEPITGRQALITPADEGPTALSSSLPRPCCFACADGVLSTCRYACTQLPKLIRRQQLGRATEAPRVRGCPAVKLGKALLWLARIL